jgi:hypothetical protein
MVTTSLEAVQWFFNHSLSLTIYGPGVCKPYSVPDSLWSGCLNVFITMIKSLPNRKTKSRAYRIREFRWLLWSVTTKNSQKQLTWKVMLNSELSSGLGCHCVLACIEHHKDKIDYPFTHDDELVVTIQLPKMKDEVILRVWGETPPFVWSCKRPALALEYWKVRTVRRIITPEHRLWNFSSSVQVVLIEGFAYSAPRDGQRRGDWIAVKGSVRLRVGLRAKLGLTGAGSESQHDSCWSQTIWFLGEVNLNSGLKWQATLTCRD